MNITICHNLTKSGDGGPILSLSELSPEERKDIRSFISFRLDWDPSSSDNIEGSDVKITAIEFIYDGISENLKISNQEPDDCCIEGSPSPVICYTLDKDVDPEEFKRCIWMSSMKYFPISRTENDEEPYFAEDQNGYTEVVDYRTSVDTFSDKKLYANKRFEFPEGVPPYEGASFQAIEFAIAPKK